MSTGRKIQGFKNSKAVGRNKPPLSNPLALCFLLALLVMIPWTVRLASMLRHQGISSTSSLIWVAADVVICGLLLAVFLLHRSRLFEVPALILGTLLLVDSCADVLTSPFKIENQALYLALFVEIPAAALCFYLVFSSEAHRGKPRRAVPGGSKARKLDSSSSGKKREMRIVQKGISD